MAAVVTDPYKENVAAYLIGIAGTAPNLTFHLYSNDVTFGDGTVPANLIEAAGNGYAPIGAPSANWTVATSQGIGTATITNPFTFAFTGPITIFGWYMTDGNNGNACVMGERLSNAPGIVNPTSLSATVILTVQDLN
jgi:hypothetical protein